MDLSIKLSLKKIIMNSVKQNKVTTTLTELFNDSRNDKFKMIKGAVRSVFRPMQPSDFEEAYLSISEEQGLYLKEFIIKQNLKHIVEFGTSFGISTLFLAQGVIETGGHISTTELLESKAKKAVENFKKAGVDHLIDVKVGNAMETLKNHDQPIDLLLLDGWKDLYHPLFRMLEPNFHKGTFIYVDNANFSESKIFLNTIAVENKYHIKYMFGGSVALISIKTT